MSRPLLAVFLAEVRTVRRLARTWLILLLAVATTFIGYVFFTNLHQQMSAVLPSATTSPRFLIASFGGYVLWILLGATVFLGFDVGNRERRERIGEVLNARPLSNPQLLIGRLVGVVAVLTVTLLLTIWATQGFGMLMAVGNDWPLAPSFQLASVAIFLLVDAIPVLVFWTACVYLLAAVLRHRLFVAVVAFALLGLGFWGLSYAPEWLLAYVDPSPDRLVSDLVRRWPDGPTLLMRLALLLFAAGFIVLAAILLPRSDTATPTRRLALVGVLLTVGILGGIAALATAHGTLTDRERWAAAAREARQGDPRAFELRGIAGEVDIDPGTRLSLDVELTLAVTDATAPRSPRGELLFHFNPGLSIERIGLDGNQVPFEHDAGILRVEAPRTGTDVRLAIKAAGVPDARFAYLDSAIDVHRVVGSNPLRGLGTEASLFDRRYVALTPGVHWLPEPMAATTGSVAPAQQFRAVDITVSVPAGWLVAGPGRRQVVEAGVFRFQPEVAVTEVALLASRFVRHATEIHGVEVELLVSRVHAPTMELYADAGSEIADAAAEVLTDMDAMGLGYPYDTLSLVEIPAPLRSYGGGWRMPSVMVSPGMLMLRERGLPTARISIPDPPPDDLARQQVDNLRRYFRRERTGGNLFAGLAHHAFLGQTGAAGPGAHALEFVCHDLATRILGRASEHFSAHVYAESVSVPDLLVDSITSLLVGGSARATGDVFAGVRAPAVWERAIGTALVDLDLDDPAQAVNILTLKGEAVARSILDELGRGNHREAARQVARPIRRQAVHGERLRRGLGGRARGLGLVDRRLAARRRVAGFPGLARRHRETRRRRRRPAPLPSSRPRLQRRGCAGTLPPPLPYRPARCPRQGRRPGTRGSPAGGRGRRGGPGPATRTLGRPLPVAEPPGVPVAGSRDGFRPGKRRSAPGRCPGERLAASAAGGHPGRRSRPGVFRATRFHRPTRGARRTR